MKMVKSLLLGAAAGLVAVAGAQAADLPVKAKPVQYVKICSLYGAGFYYIPGTDTCVKIGGYVRVQAEVGANGGGAPNLAGSTTQKDNNRSSNAYGYRTRGMLTADARSQTEYGTLRSYFNFQMEHNDGSAASGTTTDVVNIDTAFLQLGGFVAGLASSNYNFLSFAGYTYGNNLMSGDSGALGNPQLAYNLSLGNGVTATIAIEDAGHKTVGVLDAGTGGIANTTLATTTMDNGGNRLPDVVGALEVKQGWGSAQIMGASHVVSPGYQGTAVTTGPSSETGYAVGAGISLNVPSMGYNDTVAVQGNYAKGAMRYVTAAGNMTYANGDSIGYGILTDGVFGATGGVELTTGWSIGAAYQHGWSKTLKTSLYGGYVDINYNDAANTLICADIGTMTVAGGCNNDYSFWQVGSRTSWNPVSNMEIGLDVLYTELNSASAGATTTAISSSAITPTTTTIADQGVWSAMARFQRSFYP